MTAVPVASVPVAKVTRQRGRTIPADPGSVATDPRTVAAEPGPVAADARSITATRTIAAGPVATEIPGQRGRPIPADSRSVAATTASGTIAATEIARQRGGPVATHAGPVAAAHSRTIAPDRAGKRGGAIGLAETRPARTVAAGHAG